MGIRAAFIPVVRVLFGRPRDEHTTRRGARRRVRWQDGVSETEQAFRDSRTLAARLLSALRRYGGPVAAVALVVLGALYAFQNEVVLAAARSVAQRLKELSRKVEEGTADVNDADMDALRGWRWRVISWDGQR